MNVRSVGVGRVGVCILCVGNREHRERGVGVGVNDIVYFQKKITKFSKTSDKNYMPVH